MSEMQLIFALPLSRELRQSNGFENVSGVVLCWWSFLDGNQAQRWDQRNAYERMARSNVRRHIAARNAARISPDRF